jgi:RHS repeat-associated protein
MGRAATPDAARQAVASRYDARMTPAGCEEGIIRRSGRPGEYGYNALGWRVKKLVSNSGELNGTFRLLYNSAWQLIEVRAVSGGSTSVAKQFVHAGPGVPPLPPGEGRGEGGGVRAPYIDDHVAMLTPGGGPGAPGLTHYYHTDALFNTLALTCGTGDPAGGQVSERALFEPYGTAGLTDGDGEPISVSALGNPFQRQGIVRDRETGNDENRRRCYSPRIGRWAQRDPIVTLAPSLARVTVPPDSPSHDSSAATHNFMPYKSMCYQAQPEVPVVSPARLDGAGINDRVALYLMERSSPIRNVDPSGLAPPPAWWPCCIPWFDIGCTITGTGLTTWTGVASWRAPPQSAGDGEACSGIGAYNGIRDDAYGHLGLCGGSCTSVLRRPKLRVMRTICRFQ